MPCHTRKVHDLRAGGGGSGGGGGLGVWAALPGASRLQGISVGHGMSFAGRPRGLAGAEHHKRCRDGPGRGARACADPRTPCPAAIRAQCARGVAWARAGVVRCQWSPPANWRRCGACARSQSMDCANPECETPGGPASSRSANPLRGPQTTGAPEAVLPLNGAEFVPLKWPRACESLTFGRATNAAWQRAAASCSPSSPKQTAVTAEQKGMAVCNASAQPTAPSVHCTPAAASRRCRQQRLPLSRGLRPAFS